MPSAIAIRMYCVNLLDIFLDPRQLRQPKVWQIYKLTQQACGILHACRNVPVVNSTCAVLRSMQRTMCAVRRHGRSQLHQEQTYRGENAMNATVNRQVLLVEKPSGKLGPEHFKMADGAIPEPKDGEALVRSRYISLDAANRAW